MPSSDRKIQPREIHIINHSTKDVSSFLDKVEKVAKISSYIAVPIFIGIGSWFIQHAVSKQSVNKDYVQLALSILTNQDEKMNESIRPWAVKLLNETSPVTLDVQTAKDLSTGRISLPSKIFSHRGEVIDSSFITEVFSEWNHKTPIAPEFKTILVEFADDFIKGQWQIVATYFEPKYYNEQLSFLGTGRLNREGILKVSRQFIHEALIGQYDTESKKYSIYRIDVDKITQIKFIDIVDIDKERALLKLKLIQDDGKVLESGYEFMKDSFYFLGAYG